MRAGVIKALYYLEASEGALLPWVGADGILTAVTHPGADEMGNPEGVRGLEADG